MHSRRKFLTALCAVPAAAAFVVKKREQVTEEVVEHALEGRKVLDVAIDFDKLIKQAHVPDDPELRKRWSDSVVKTVRKAFDNLKSDEVFVHSDVISVREFTR